MILGHKVQINYFEKLKRNSCLSSSYLFFGKEGIGKLSFAIELARSLTLPQEIFVISKNKLISQKNSDLSLASFENSIGIKEIKNLIDFLTLTSPQKKFGIIDEAHLLTFEAQNALLKILEEPPKDTYLILVSQLPFQLLETILSRVIKIQFLPLSLKEMENFLKNNFKNLKENEIKEIAFLSSGLPKKAIEILENKEKYFSFKKNISKFLTSSIEEKLNFLDSLNLENLNLFFEEIFLFLEKELIEKKDKKTLNLAKKLFKNYWLINFKKINPNLILEEMTLSS